MKKYLLISLLAICFAFNADAQYQLYGSNVATLGTNLPTFSGSNLFSGVINATNLTNAFSGNGNGLTNVLLSMPLQGFNNSGFSVTTGQAGYTAAFGYASGLNGAATTEAMVTKNGYLSNFYLFKQSVMPATTNVTIRIYSNSFAQTPTFASPVALTLNGGLITQSNVVDTTSSITCTNGQLFAVGWSNAVAGATGTVIFGWGCTLYYTNGQ